MESPAGRIPECYLFKYLSECLKPVSQGATGCQGLCWMPVCMTAFKNSQFVLQDAYETDMCERGEDSFHCI